MNVTVMAITCQGQHRCDQCVPSLRMYVPTNPSDRRGEQHFSVVFGDRRSRYPNLTVRLNDCDVSNCVQHSWAGESGWVYALCKNEHRRFHLCGCRKGICAVVLHGHVTVSL